MRSLLSLHMPDADRLTTQEIAATLDLKPAAMLCLVYAQWDADKGVAEQITDLAIALGHDRLYVRFHADPHPPGYAKKIGGPEAWGRLCAQRMTQYYQPLADRGVQLHAILANETDADYEGGLSVQQASDFYRRCMTEYAAKRPQDVLHVPAPTGAPQTHREHLERFRDDGWVQPHWFVDGHGYDGDLENVVNVLYDVFPGHQYVITETNDLADFDWPIQLLEQGRARDIVYFTLSWARGGEGRVQPPTPDDAAKQMSLMRFPTRYAQFKATVVSAPEPVPEPEPEPTPMYRVPTWTPSYEHIRDGALQVADEFGIPRRRMLGLCLAESGFGLQSFDRWASIERSKRMVAAIDAQNWPVVEAIFAEIAGTTTNDISFGPAHQSWWWSLTAADQQAHPEWRHDLTRIMEFRAHLIEDHGAALRLAAGKVTGTGDDVDILCRYNKPSIPPAENPNRSNYLRSLVEADRILGTTPVPVPTPEPPPIPSTPEFLFGFRGLADVLGATVVGSPTTNEGPFKPEDLTVQYTTRGMMLYHKPTNRPYFVPGHSTGTAVAAPPFTPQIISRPSPNHGGVRAATIGCVMHSTRGSASSPENEFQGTLNWFANPAAQVSAHIVIAHDGRIAECVDPDLEAWHARAENVRRLGIELCQQRPGDHITDEQLRSAAWWLKRMATRFGFSLTAEALPEHRQTPSGVQDGKSDIGSDYSFERLSAFF